jgi:hypothetical protein
MNEQCPSCQDTGWQEYVESGWVKVRYCPRGCDPVNPEEIAE